MKLAAGLLGAWAYQLVIDPYSNPPVIYHALCVCFVAHFSSVQHFALLSFVAKPHSGAVCKPIPLYHTLLLPLLRSCVTSNFRSTLCFALCAGSKTLSPPSSQDAKRCLCVCTVCSDCTPVLELWCARTTRFHRYPPVADAKRPAKGACRATGSAVCRCIKTLAAAVLPQRVLPDTSSLHVWHTVMRAPALDSGPCVVDSAFPPSILTSFLRFAGSALPPCVQFTQYSAYLWDITTLIPGIPVLAIMVHVTLAVHALIICRPLVLALGSITCLCNRGACQQSNQPVQLYSILYCLGALCGHCTSDATAS